ncbi:putative transmembrane protein [Toxoplasma gondii TgCatPRC2]|uniref:Putative transmembrane protein n=1 Tax=Toxoplasma gondii TgCatPRC2 TaxID=1130821 RepID=A0A151HLU2_TOXGO|nr:putative transmembrane protein [Toxoplasma gondii TgCatPRC2]
MSCAFPPPLVHDPSACVHIYIYTYTSLYVLLCSHTGVVTWAHWFHIQCEEPSCACPFRALSLLSLLSLLLRLDSCLVKCWGRMADVTAPVDETETPLSQESSSAASGEAGRRMCFICLDGVKRSRRNGQLTGDLLPCCSQCFAVVHRKCWSIYRRRQQLAAFRSRLLGQRTPNPNRCSICKTGRAGVEGDETFQPQRRQNSGSTGSGVSGTTSALQEQLLASLGRLLQDDDDDADDPPLCSGMCTCINTGLLLGVLLLDLILIATTSLYPLEVLLLSLFITYNIVTLQIIWLAVKQRRESVGPLLSPELESDSRQASGGESPDSNSDDNLDGSRGNGSPTGGRHSRRSGSLDGDSSDSGRVGYFGVRDIDVSEEDLEIGGRERGSSRARRVGLWTAAGGRAASASSRVMSGARFFWCFLSRGGTSSDPSLGGETGGLGGSEGPPSEAFHVAGLRQTPLLLPGVELQLLRESRQEQRGQSGREELLV